MPNSWTISPLTTIGCAIVAIALSFDVLYSTAVPGIGLRQWFGVAVGLYLVAIDWRWRHLPARPLWDWLLLAPYLLVILLAVLMPGEPVFWHRRAFLGTEFFSTRDLVINVAAFLPLGLLLAPLLRRAGRPRDSWRLVAAVAAIGGLFSLAVETAQFLWIAGRYSSASDLFANTLGFALGAAIYAACLHCCRPVAGPAIYRGKSI